jgi:predicted GTPase
VDPRPFALGSIQKTFEKFSHLGKVLPAMGYSEIQRHELEETIRRVPCDLVLVATPIDLSRAIRLEKPYVRVRYEVEEIGRAAITELIEEFTEAHRPALVGARR